MAGLLASPLLPALPSSVRLARPQSVVCNAQTAQQTSKRPAQGPAGWGTGQLKSADISKADSQSGSLSARTTPLDVLLDDVKFLQAKTGLDLMTPLQEVKGVHDQVCLNGQCTAILYILHYNLCQLSHWLMLTMCNAGGCRFEPYCWREDAGRAGRAHLCTAEGIGQGSHGGKGRLFFAAANVSHSCRIRADLCYVPPELA